MNSNVTNKYLKKALIDLQNALEGDGDASSELMVFINELKMSNLLIPGIDDGEDLIYETLISEEDDMTFLPLFTDSEEFYKFYDEDSEYEPIANEFEIYAGISEDVDAIIIDAEGEEFIATKEMIELACEDFSAKKDDVEAKDASQIRQIYDSISNESLSQFIADESNANDFEGLMVEISASKLLDLVVSEDSLDEFGEDGIIKAEDVDGFSLCTLEDDEGGRYAILFTDKNAIADAIDDDLFYYAQITNVSALFEFVLRNDMDGVVINPNGDEFIIPRSVLLAQASGIELVAEDASLSNSLEYTFKL